MTGGRRWPPAPAEALWGEDGLTIVTTIVVSFTIVGYARRVRWTLKLQAVVFGVTVLFLLLAAGIGYGPY